MDQDSILHWINVSSPAGAADWLTGIVLALRYSIDWNRKYRELWLDRDES